MLINVVKSFNKFVLETEQKFEKNFANKTWLFFLILSFLIIGFNWVLCFNIDKTTTGDFDYFAQVYEAIRKTILEYHQFPWVNSWVGGGVPLYANPQAGVFSIQTALVLMFGTVVGLKISLILYSLVGFWSFYLLAKNTIKTSSLIAVCLSIVWVSNGFFMSHYIGHYTFALFQIFPLLCYLILNVTKPRYWLYLSIAISAITLSALHYAALQSLLALFIIAALDLIVNKKKRKQKLILYSKTVSLFLVICAHRIIYTLDYVMDFPRVINDPSNSVSVLLKSFVIPPDPSRGIYGDIVRPVPSSALQPYAWGEFNAFVGWAIVIAFAVSVISIVYIKKRGERKISLYLLGLPVLYFVIALGNFANWSPNTLIHLLPGFSGMRISSRWLIWVIFFALIFMGYCLRNTSSRTSSNIIKILLVIGSIELFIVSFPLVNSFTIPVNQIRASSARFEQFDNYDHYNQPKNIALYQKRVSLDRKYQSYGFEATLNNYGEVRGYEPLVDTRFDQTQRCGITNGCNFVLSNNADLLKWSPNEVVLSRTNSKTIELNMSPSNYLVVNGERVFADKKVVEVNQKMLIKDSSEIITIMMKPKTIIEMTLQKINEITSKIIGKLNDRLL